LFTGFVAWRADGGSAFTSGPWWLAALPLWKGIARVSTKEQPDCASTMLPSMTNTSVEENESEIP
jgi:hypothetical protein